MFPFSIMKIFFSIFIVAILCSCGNSALKVFDRATLQKDLFDTTFNYSDIKSIDIVEIEHPMLGGILSTQTLSTEQRELFIQRLENLERAGIYKCASKYVIRMILIADTLRLKNCGEKISRKDSDFYYCLPDSGRIIGDFIQK